mmetsp:Transcript_120771/g.240538  ORF Transcript_120771/g.240538 Transcript_120771/m.240538 type:complete len:207 (-) Transcript_120771:170-790(-)
MCSAEDPHAVLFPVLPLTGEFSSIGPQKCALSLLEVVHILTLISTTVGPFISPLTMHTIVYPLPTVLPAILPCESACALDIVVPELTVVDRTVWPFKPPSAMFLPVRVSTGVLGGVVPLLDSLTVFQITLPLTYVLRLLRSICATTMRFAVLPVAVIDVAIRVNEAALAMLHAVLPLTFISRAIREDLVLEAVCLARMMRLDSARY